MSLSRGLRSMLKLSAPSRLNASPRYFATLPPEVVVFPDQDTVVCWHPEQEFPYECSRPLPEPEQLPYSILKIQEKDVKATFARKKGDLQIALECAELTYTKKNAWFPRSRDKRAKKTEFDRPYL